jgi:uncharacterized protein
MLIIDIAPLKEGTHLLNLEPSPEDVGLDAKEFRDIEVDVVINHYNRRFLLDISTTAVATLECDRTLVLFDTELHGDYRMLCVPDGMSVAQDDDRDEVRFFDPVDPKLDLADVVHDTIRLSVPQRKVAPDAVEADLPTRFGGPAEGDIDPRWSALKDLGGEEQK